MAAVQPTFSCCSQRTSYDLHLCCQLMLVLLPHAQYNTAPTLTPLHHCAVAVTNLVSCYFVSIVALSLLSAKTYPTPAT